ncbi:MAG: PaaI family thioesterase [Gammaproteobacteria bacterium]|nr:PaaI family thioesterase [Gammaproteobacteria bacterium]
MKQKALQDYCEEAYSYCYGCGHLNEKGLQLKSYREGNEAVAIFQPKSYHIAVPGFVYGGLIASLIDCHSIAIAAASAAFERGENISAHLERFVTGSLKVDYLQPTPLGIPLEIRGHAEEVHARKIVVNTVLLVDKKVCARGHVVAVRMPDIMKESA